MEALIGVTAPEHLSEVVDVVHDQWFSLDKVAFDESTNVLRVPFEMITRRSGIRGWLGAKESRMNWTLEIRGVRTYRIEDSEGIDSYDFNELLYASSEQLLSITTGVPLRFEVSVTGLDVSVQRDHAELPTLSEFQTSAEDELLAELEDLGVRPGLRGLGGGAEAYLRLGIEDLDVWFYWDGEGSVIGRGMDRMFERWDYRSPGELSKAIVAAVVESFSEGKATHG